MSRFHDEFFKQNGPEHDKLLIKCLSLQNLAKIIGSIPLDWTQKIQGHNWNYGNYDVNLRIDNSGIVYETEVICQKGNFIIGYADLLISRWAILHATGIIRRGGQTVPYDGLWRRGGNDCPSDNHADQIIVEVKPRLTDIGAALRQLKTYQSILQYRDTTYPMGCVCSPTGYPRFKVHGDIFMSNTPRLAIVTNENLDRDSLAYLAHEGVQVIRESDLLSSRQNLFAF